jgi:hypothetical protein
VSQLLGASMVLKVLEIQQAKDNNQAKYNREH